tara:strand:- start:114 stop:1211 length:1098 start_codon:yes stop_codon:yes gene_type:complete
MIRKLLGDFLIISFITFLIFLIIEVFLFFLNFPLKDDRSFNNSFEVTFAGGARHKPNIKSTTRLGYPALSTDSTGLVHNGILRNKDELQNAIFVLGGSTVEGWGASSNMKTIPAQLELCLNKNLTKKVVVANGGFQGDYSYQEFQRAVNIISRYNPKMIIILDGRNDGHFGMMKNWVAFDSNPGIHGPLDYINKAGHRGRKDQIIHEMRSISRLINWVINVKDNNSRKTNLDKFSFDENITNTKISKIASSYLITHKLIHEIGKAYNVPIFSYLQPTLEAKKELNSYEKELLEKFRKRMKWPLSYYDQISNFYDEVSSRLPNEIIDYSNIFNDLDINLYVDSNHYNDEGNLIISEKICKNILNFF